MNFFLLVLVGFFIGIISGCFGVGGGFLYVPFFHTIFSGEKIPDPMQKAVGTSFCIIIPASIIALIKHTYLGNVEIKSKLMILLIIGSLLGAYLGAYLADYLPEKYLKKLFGILLLMISMKFIFR
jgi:hypothetical protein